MWLAKLCKNCMLRFEIFCLESGIIQLYFSGKIWETVVSNLIFIIVTAVVSYSDGDSVAICAAFFHLFTIVTSFIIATVTLSRCHKCVIQLYFFVNTP